MKKLVAFLCVSVYTFPVMIIPSLNTADVTDLSFVSIADRVDDNWAEWEVEFDYNGKPHVGFLGACPIHPELSYEDTITEAEELE
jgi:hypothetical protein